MTAITIDSITKVTPRAATKHIRHIIQAGLVPYLRSSPGLGKSSIFKQIAEEFKLKVIDHRLSTSAPEDLSGLPRFTADGHAAFAPFTDIFPTEGQEIPEGYDGWLLLLDEFPSAPRSVQAAAYKLVLDRAVGQHNLHPNVIIACAGNLDTDNAIVNPIGTAMQSRLVHLQMKEDFDEWHQDVALKNRYDGRIIAYLSAYKSKLMDFRPDHQNSTFCCPRTWEFVQKLLSVDGTPHKLTAFDVPMLAGTITAEVATEFFTFCELFDQMISVKDVVANPDTTQVPEKNDLKWATIAYLAEHISEENLGQLAIYVRRFPMNFAILFYRMLIIQHPTMRAHAEFKDAMVRMTRYLNGGII